MISARPEPCSHSQIESFRLPKMGGCNGDLEAAAKARAGGGGC